MALEDLTGDVYIDSLVATNPVGSTDKVKTLDDHVRGIKNVLLKSFPSITGAVTATNAELSKLAGVTATTAEINKLAGLSATTTELNKLSGVTATTTEINKLAGLLATTAELNKLSGVTATTAQIEKLATITATSTEINKLTGATLSTTELNYVTGVTSAIQTQLDTKALASRTLTAGNGITGGGDLSANRTFTLGTPGSVTSSSTNGVTATSHTHALANGAVTTAKLEAAEQMTTTNVLNATASATLDAVGTYALLKYTGVGSVASGGTALGAQFRFTNVEGTTAGIPTGTWRVMGAGVVSGTITLGLKISS
jgi:hypothetical protein